MKSSDYVQSLEKGLNILRVFDREHPRLTLSEVAELTGLTRASARRFLLTFAHLNYMGFDGKYFSLNSKILDPGNNYLPAHITSLGRILLAYLPPEDLATRLGDLQYDSLTEHTLHTREALKAELHKVKRQG